MAKEHSSISNKTTSSASAAADSYIGSFISLTTKSEIRYEGVLYCLNPQDSTLGLRNVRSYGTEGRKKDGPQVPPNDKIYEYILFRGSDIKDLEVKTVPPAQLEEPIYNDPAVVQSNNYVGPSSAFKSVPAAGGPLTEFNLYCTPSVLNASSYPSVLPSHHSGNQFGQCGSSLSTHNAAPLTQWQGHSGAPGSIPGAHQHSLLSSTTLYPLQNQESTNMAATNLSDVSSGFATSSPIYFNATPTMTSEELCTSFTESVSTKLPHHFQHSTLTNSNGLTMPFPLTHQNTISIEAPAVNKVFPDHVLQHPAQSSPHSTLSVSDPISQPLLRQPPSLLAPNPLPMPRLSEHSPENNLYPDQNDVSDIGSMSLKPSSSATTTSLQPPLMPLPPPTVKLQYSSQFTEEFDFQAMNEKFKKDEVWGYLGKANQRYKRGGIQENGTTSQDSGDELVSCGEPKPAYNKDDFFDTLSCNTARRARNGLSRSSERMKLNSETYGNSGQRTQLGYDGSGAGYDEVHGPHSWGRWYNYGNRGRGSFRQR